MEWDAWADPNPASDFVDKCLIIHGFGIKIEDGVSILRDVA